MFLFMDRLVVRVSGESGSGIDSAGHIIMHSLKQCGYYVVADREYPSLIKWWCASYQINISTKPIFGQSSVNHIGVWTTRAWVLDCIERLQENSIILSWYEKVIQTDPHMIQKALSQKIQIIHIPALRIAQMCGGSIAFTNTVLIGALWSLLWGNYKILKKEMSVKFGKKQSLLDINLACLKEGFEYMWDTSARGFDYIASHTSIRTTRCNLTLVSQEDAKDIHPFHTSQVCQYMSHPHTSDDFVYTEKRINQYIEKFDSHESCVYVVREASTQKFIGMIWIHHLHTSSPHLSLRIRTQMQWKWYGPEIMSWVIQYVRQAGYAELIYQTFTSNYSSIKLVQLLGGVYTHAFETSNWYGVKMECEEYRISCQYTSYDIHDFLGELYTSGWSYNLLIEGNTALALGAIHAGVRAYYAYPMSPSSSILSYLAKVAPQTGMLVKQVEDEISVVNMTLGSMYTGARALCATSGWWFDLMTETVSLSAMIEVPLVIVVAQRPGPATGLPTWTAQWDLNLALYGWHGEFAKCVIAVSDPQSAFELIQHAFNIAETYHIPVIVLTEKTIAETYQVVDMFNQYAIPIHRWLVTDAVMLSNLKPEHRFALTDTGVSFRRIPGSNQTISYTNGDEHHPDGTLDESPEVKKMMDKRLKKLQTIKDHLPWPRLIWSDQTSVTLVWRGSTINPVRDAIPVLLTQGISVNYLHYDYVRPLKTETLQALIDRGNHMILIEGNATWQFGGLVAQEFGYRFVDRLLKYDGRPRYVEEIVHRVQTLVW
jgi:pyruvate/2-oxoacid:ferredoxin oxidoreductase alpha subunit/Pyruvate/2-oxoacid:ferredoxin oxidoreductase gamma subunit/RimJ/RimL family protein N-acetyltransferase